jgi:hypothetical protein
MTSRKRGHWRGVYACAAIKPAGGVCAVEVPEGHPRPQTIRVRCVCGGVHERQKIVQWRRRHVNDKPAEAELIEPALPEPDKPNEG